MPQVDHVANAANLVCVAIGANLLLPVAPSIMGRFFDGIEIDADKIVTNKFGDVRKYVCEDDIADIGTIASSVKRRREACQKNPGLLWRIVDVLFAVAGIVLLWLGWTKDETVAAWCPILFLPLLIAAGYPFTCFVCTLIRLKWNIFWTRRHAISKMKAEKKKKDQSEDKFREAFINQAKTALSR